MWKIIPGSEKYEVSTEGHIRNKKTKQVLHEFKGKGWRVDKIGKETT